MKANHMRVIVLSLLFCGCIPAPSGPTPNADGIEVIPPMPLPVQSSPIESPPAPVSETSLPPESEAGVSNQADPPSVETVPSPSAATGGESIQKPVVVCFTSQEGVYCPGCIAAKKWHDAADKGNLPFTLEFKTDYPEWVEAVPTFYWKGKDEWKKIEGFYGGEYLVKAWEGTQ